MHILSRKGEVVARTDTINRDASFRWWSYRVQPVRWSHTDAPCDRTRSEAERTERSNDRATFAVGWMVAGRSMQVGLFVGQ